jgi:hypothetical protein
MDARMRRATACTRCGRGAVLEAREGETPARQSVVQEGEGSARGVAPRSHQLIAGGSPHWGSHEIRVRRRSAAHRM